MENRYSLVIAASLALAACAGFRAVEIPTDPRRACELDCLAALVEEHPDPKKIAEACGPCPGDPPYDQPPDSLDTI
jgi:hypothetical protein